MTKAIFPLIAIIMQFILNPSAHAHPSEMVTHKNSMHKTIEEWDKVAIRDIKKVHDIISETHPAKLDEENLEFNHWLEFGYQKSLLLAGRSRSKEQAWAAVNYYLTGFMDEHLTAGRVLSQSSHLYWAGFVMSYKNGRYFATSKANVWPVDLPQIGDEIISCDGVDITEILRSKVAPFVDRRTYLDNTLEKLSRYMTLEQSHHPLWDPLRPMSCIIQKPDGERHEISLLWKKQTDNTKIGRQPAPQQGMHQIKKGVYWIHASNFMLDAEAFIKFESLLNEVRALGSADAVVLDTRGNNGGDSSVGSRLLRALLKSNTPLLNEARAYWRVSPLAMETLKAHSTSALQIEGRESTRYKWLDGLSESMATAARRGENFIEQAHGSAIDDEDTGQEVPPFQGKLILITDSYCNSACLDFVDEVMSVPGALHVGSTTNADTRYIDVGSVMLPSGLKLWVPLKVWVGRRRQDNVPYVPQIKYHQDLDDTKAVQDWVLGSVLPVASRIGKP
ncbi:hypothetical protein Daci_3058 [Delftia acidovorans SPH-1]|uniref:Uncharacterized protein n=2 Tax=Comamonadaceae TaxID=80864 RepID=A9C260_DELAS|nr:hypothetical protein Daci_3058 [Delftia acidovorans SPH-1]